MADNSTLPVSVGTEVFANDDIGGVKYPRAKLSLGATGVAVDAEAGAGAVGNGVQRITLASDDPAVAFLTTMDADTGILAGAVAGSEMQVDIVAALPAGTNAIGKLAANSGVDIGDVDILSIAAGENHLGAAGGHTAIVDASSTITRPADTTAYATGDLVANSTTAGSVNALSFTTAARVSGGSGLVVGARIQKSTNTTTNAAFRLHLFTVVPTFTSAGDNSAISTVVQASGKGYLGYIDIPSMTGFAAVAWGTGAPDNARGGLPFVAVAQTLYGIVTARGAYTPGSAEVFTVSIMVLQD